MSPIEWLPDRYQPQARAAKNWLISASSFGLALSIVAVDVYKGVDLKSTNGLIVLLLLIIGLIAQREKSMLDDLKSATQSLILKVEGASALDDNLSLQLNALRAALSNEQKIMTFESAINQTIMLVDHAGVVEMLEIEHLGLDMTHAPEQIRRLFRALPRVRSVVYRVLMLARTDGSTNQYEEDIDALLESGSRRKIEFQRELTRISKELQREGRSLEFQLCFYEAVPVIHGFRVVKPLDIASLSLCRWHEGEYHWGADQYRVLRQSDLSGSDRDLLQVLKATFTHHWELGRTA